jgi:alpha-tubulin suppressor-like RCC1 family protein
MKKHFASSRRLTAGFALTGALLVFASCSVDTSDLKFIPDDEFNNGSGGSGGSGGSSSTNGGDGSGGEAGGVMVEDCTPGEINCSDEGFLRECQDGDPPAYDEGEDCGEPGQCSVLRNKCLECVPGAFRCAGVVLEQCDMAGEIWEIAQTCVDEDSCVGTGQTGYCKVCEPGISVCDAEVASLSGGDGGAVTVASQVYSCSTTGEYLELAASCQGERPVCNIATKDCGECVPGYNTCVGSSPRSCQSDGQYEWGTNCSSAAACDEITGDCDDTGLDCQPGTIRCDDAQLQYCGYDGHWLDQELCPSPGLCDANGGKCLDCDPSVNFSCVDDAVTQCLQSGDQGNFTWRVEQCKPGQCGGSFCNNGCVAGEWYCSVNSNTYSVCDGSGNFYGEPVACPSGQICDPIAKDCVECIPNHYRCDQNGVLKRCADDGAAEATIENCQLAGKLCDADRGACLDNNPGWFHCNDNDQFVQLQSDGSELVVESCGEGQCDKYDGCREDLCPEGAIACDGRDVRICEDGYFQESDETCSSATACQPALGCTIPIALGAGYQHSCAILTNPDLVDGVGFVVCWGANDRGQLGTGSDILSDSVTPRRVALKIPSDGGSDDPLPGGLVVGTWTLPVFTRVCGGRDFSCADIQSPENPGQTFVACWGSNEFGQLGKDVPEPEPINGLALPFFVNAGIEDGDPKETPGVLLGNVVCGEQFACAIDDAGKAHCWGRNDMGQLGVDSTEEFIPFASEVSGDLTFVELAAGAKHVCGVDEDGGVWCWGDGAFGQLGGAEGPAPLPVQIADLTVSQVGDAFPIAGRDFSAVLVTAGDSPMSWGGNLFGQLVNGGTEGQSAPGAMSVATTEALALFGGSLAQHQCLRGPDGALSCAGANVFGQLGNGSTVDTTEFVEVMPGGMEPADTLSEVRDAVAVGGRHTCAINAANEVHCWGANHRHQLGSTKSTPQTSLQKVF